MVLIPKVISSSFATLYFSASSKDLNEYSLPNLVSVKTEDDSDSDSSTEFENEKNLSSSLIQLLELEETSSLSEQPQQSQPCKDDIQHRHQKSVHFDDKIHVCVNNDNPMTDAEKKMAFYNVNEINIIRRENKSLTRFLRHMGQGALSSMFFNDYNGNDDTVGDEEIICSRGLEKLMSDDLKSTLRMRRKQMIRTVLHHQDECFLLPSDDALRQDCMLRDASIKISKDCMTRAYQLAQEDYQYVQQNVYV